MKDINRKLSNKMLGNVFIWTGTLTWIVYIIMVKNGKDISIWPFLVFYAGDLGRAWGPRKTADQGAGDRNYFVQSVRSRTLVPKLPLGN